MWNDIPKQWQAVFEEAWLAFTQGNVPCGSVICDSKGNILVRDHNRFGDRAISNPNISHSDANALTALDLRSGVSPDKLTLFTSLEPCHMCMGMIALTGIKNVRCASSDLYMGTAHYLTDDPYYRSLAISCRTESGDIEIFQLVLISCFMIKQLSNRFDSSALNCYRRTNEIAVDIAEKLCMRRVLDRMVIEKKTAEEVFNTVITIKNEKYT